MNRLALFSLALAAALATLPRGATAQYALGSGDGETGAGVDAAAAGVLGVALLLAFELLSVLAGSQAASVSDSSTIAKSFFVMIVLHSYQRSGKGVLVPFFAG